MAFSDAANRVTAPKKTQSYKNTSNAQPTVAPRSGYGTTTAAGVYTPSGGIPAISTPKSAARTPSYGGSGGGGGAASAALAAPVMGDDDYLASGADSAYTAQLAALQKALADQQADAAAQTSKYNVDYGDSLKNLGWIQDDPATQINEGAWNFTDQNTAAGRGFQNQQNDFAGRGLLQSSLYGEANDNLTRSLNDQLTGINTGKQSFMDDLARQSTSFANDNTLSVQQARAEAIARRAAGAQLG